MKEYPYVIIDWFSKEVIVKCNTLEKAHEHRLLEQSKDTDRIIMLYDENKKKFIEWRKKEFKLLSVFENNPSKRYKYLQNLLKKYER